MKRLYTSVVLFALTLTCMDKTWCADGQSMLATGEEMNMLLSGRIDVGSDGRVNGYRLDHVDRLPAAVLKLVARTVPHWRFAPPAGGDGPVPAQARMGLNVVAKQTADDRFDLRIAGASFDESARSPEEKIRPVDIAAPRFPEAASRTGLSGTAYVVVKINREGTVDDAAIEQVNLTVIGNDYQMARGRDVLAQATRAAARRWTFAPPTSGESADDPYWLARIPVDFRFFGRDRQPGVWEAYVPGPRTPAPWTSKAQESAAFKPDAMLAGSAYTAGSGLQLLTPLDE